MENGYAGPGTRLGVAAVGVILAAIGLTSAVSDGSVAQLAAAPTPDAIVEDQPPAAIPAAESARTVAAPITVAAADETAQSELKRLVQAWRDAWASQDTAAYLSFYAADFQGNADSPEQWRANRKRIIGQAKFIDIRIGQADINLKSDGQATITLPLDYASDRFKDHGTKVLDVRRSDGKWLIEGETFVAD